jgi:hypothetical protein
VPLWPGSVIPAARLRRAATEIGATKLLRTKKNERRKRRASDESASLLPGVDRYVVMEKPGGVAANSGERVRLARWFWRLAKTNFAGKRWEKNTR